VIDQIALEFVGEVEERWNKTRHQMQTTVKRRFLNYGSCTQQCVDTVNVLDDKELLKRK
jgi:hypothetical protein